VLFGANFFDTHLSDACTVKFIQVEFHHQFRNELYNHQSGYDTRYQDAVPMQDFGFSQVHARLHHLVSYQSAFVLTLK
jgi:hypothetical protein